MEQPSREDLLQRIASLEAELAVTKAELALSSASPARSVVHGPRPHPAPAAAGGAKPPGGPLDGIKILDFSQYQNGPTATMMLSDYGADVIKVERPGGEAGRALGGKDKTGYYFSTYFQALNRGKRSCPLDMNKEGAREVEGYLAALEEGFHKVDEGLAFEVWTLAGAALRTLAGVAAVEKTLEVGQSRLALS